MSLYQPCSLLLQHPKAGEQPDPWASLLISTALSTCSASPWPVPPGQQDYTSPSCIPPVVALQDFSVPRPSFLSPHPLSSAVVLASQDHFPPEEEEIPCNSPGSSGKREDMKQMLETTRSSCTLFLPPTSCFSLLSPQAFKPHTNS